MRPLYRFWEGGPEAAAFWGAVMLAYAQWRRRAESGVPFRKMSATALTLDRNSLIFKGFDFCFLFQQFIETRISSRFFAHRAGLPTNLSTAFVDSKKRTLETGA